MPPIVIDRAAGASVVAILPWRTSLPAAAWYFPFLVLAVLSVFRFLRSASAKNEKN
jgi:hypothetical protein